MQLPILNGVARDYGALVSSRNKRGKGMAPPTQPRACAGTVAYGLTRPGSRRGASRVPQAKPLDTGWLGGAVGSSRGKTGGRREGSQTFAKLRFTFHRVASLVR